MLVHWLSIFQQVNKQSLDHAGAQYAAWSADSSLVAVSFDRQDCVKMWHVQHRTPFTCISFSPFVNPLALTFLPGPARVLGVCERGRCWLAGGLTSIVFSALKQ